MCSALFFLFLFLCRFKSSSFWFPFFVISDNSSISYCVSETCLLFRLSPFICIYGTNENIRIYTLVSNGHIICVKHNLWMWIKYTAHTYWEFRIKPTPNSRIFILFHVCFFFYFCWDNDDDDDKLWLHFVSLERVKNNGWCILLYNIQHHKLHLLHNIQSNS